MLFVQRISFTIEIRIMRHPHQLALIDWIFFVFLIVTNVVASHTCSRLVLGIFSLTERYMVNTWKFALDSIIIFNEMAFINTNALLLKIISKTYNFLLNIFPGEQSVLFFIQLHYLLKKKIKKKSL